MVFVFPASPAQYAALVMAVAAISVGLSSLFPVRWGWKAFPLLALALSGVAAMGLGTAIIYADATFSNHGYNVVITSRTMLLIVAIAGVAFGLTLSARRRAS